jgi:hypothetical protein
MKAHQIGITAVVAAAAALVGCSVVTVESAWQADGLKNASFDLQCPAEKVEMTVLKRNDGLGCLGSKVGARGCGKQTTYECDNARTWHRSAEVSTVTPAK